MITFIARPRAGFRLPADARRRGFSLVELMVSIGIASIVLGGVISAFIFIARSSLSTSDYSDMDGEARRSLEIFARDVRMARDVTSFSASAVTLDVVTSSGSTSVNYTYVPATKTFYRAYGTPNQRTLIRGIESFQLSRYSIATDPDTGLPREATNALETKQIQLELRAVRSGAAKAFASNNVVSARYILRNKL